jgi:DNA-binding transcriptional MerR regulator
MKPLNSPLFTVGVVSSLVGISSSTIRHWEAEGLIAPLREGRNRRRLYSWRDVERLQEIRYLVTRRRIRLRDVRLHLTPRTPPAVLPMPAGTRRRQRAPLALAFN